LIIAPKRCIIGLKKYSVTYVQAKELFMSEKNFHILKRSHQVLIVILAVLSIVMATVIAYYIGAGKSTLSDNVRTGLWLYLSYNIAQAIALGCGYVYFAMDYSKKSAVYYKAFLVLVLIANVFPIITMFYYNMNIVELCLACIKIIALLILIFGKDLGKRKTWIVFSIYFIAELLVGVVVITDGSIAVYRIICSISRLLLAGTIALAIMGKYRDKDQRETV
jgi:hypothetical protein